MKNLDRVYRLMFDSRYQSLALADPLLLASPALHFNSTSKAGLWESIDLISIDSHKPEPDFWQIEGVPAGFACNNRVLKHIPVLWAGKICEPLPVRHGGRTLWLGNITEHGCWNALDVARCVWPSGVPGIGLPSHYTFFPHRLGFMSVLTVPETCEHELYVHEYSGDPTNEFKGGVEREKLTGLSFKEIWSDGTSEL